MDTDSEDGDTLCYATVSEAASDRTVVWRLRMQTCPIYTRWT